MKYTVIALLLCGLSIAQISQKKSSAKSDKDQLIDFLKSDLERERAKTSELEKRVAELQAKDAEWNKKYNELGATGMQVLAIAQNLDKEITARIVAYNLLVDKYNATLNQANNVINQQNAVLAQRQRVANALAAYGVMQQYNRPQTLNVNVTDCTKLPALCIH
jgi:hypothetical protein